MSESWLQVEMPSVDEFGPVALPVCPRRFDRCAGEPFLSWEFEDECSEPDDFEEGQ